LKYHQKKTQPINNKGIDIKAAIKLQKTKTEIPPVQFCIEKTKEFCIPNANNGITILAADRI
jgi:hypothetical protein